MTLDSAVSRSATGSSGPDGLRMALAQCPAFPKCSKNPISRVSHIKNELMLSVRKHVRSFYQGYLACEDPSCPQRTRQMSLRFMNGYPACQGCKTQAMAKEVRNYN